MSGAVPETIVNRGSAGGVLPAWVGFVLGFWFPLWAIVEVVVFALLVPETTWFFWFWSLYFVFMVFAIWAANVVRVEVGPDRIAVRRGLRSQVAALEDVVRVDVSRTEWLPRLQGHPRAYRASVLLTSGRHWVLDFLEPAAKDRLLAALHRYGRPIWVHPPA